jgi:signal transduction histidine kinase/DNA-binding NarL/FixJ family response regulator
MPWRLSTSFTLALLIGLLALVGQWVSHSVSASVLEASLREREIDKVNALGGVLQGLIAQRGQEAQVVARLLAADAALVGAMALSGPARAERLAQELKLPFRDSGMARMELTGLDEVLVYRAHAPARQGARNTAWGVAEALAGTGMVVSSREGGEVMVQAIEPLRDGPRVVGTISAGTVLDKALFDKLGQQLGAQLTLLSRRPVVQAERAAAEHVDAAAVTEAFEKKIPIFRVDEASHHTSAYLPVVIVDEAYVVLARLDSDAAYRLLDEGKRRSALFAALTLIASVAIGLLALRVALGPLRRLSSRAVQTAVELTGSSIATSGHDEVASVVTVLQTLTDRLALRNRELQEASAQADAANRAKSQFLSAMSHEIRTPLNGLLGMTELLRGTRLEAEQARYVNLIASAGEALNALLGDILDLAKIEEGQITMERVDFDLEQTLSDVVGVYGEVAAGRGLELVADIAAIEPRRVCGDPTRLRQVLSNLLGNATKFTERGEVALRCERIKAPPADARLWWRFTVSDSGIGIAPQAIDRLFQRFVQADASTTRQFGGSGLGLAICKHLVELMGGSIHVQSEPGRGSRFWFNLPFEHATQPVRPIAPATLHERTRAARVLVVEDNALNQQVIQGLLGHLGAHVSVAGNGSEALAALDHACFDLVFMDCQMPVMDGFEATRRLRALERLDPSRRAVPVIALTANALSGDRDACLAAGMSDYVTKPVTQAKLAEALSRHLAWREETPDSAALPCADGATGPDDPAAFDPGALNSLPMVQDGSDPGFADQMLTMFMAGTHTTLAAIESASSAGDTGPLQRLVHTLKSTAAQVGAPALAAEAERQEALLRAGVAPAAEGPGLLRAAFERFEQALVTHRDHAGHPPATAPVAMEETRHE